MPSKYEKITKKKFEINGCKVDTKWGMNRWSKNKDYWGLFDLLIVDPEGNLRMIAIKGHAGVPKKLRDGIQQFGINKIIKEIWVYRLNGTVKKEIIED